MAPRQRCFACYKLRASGGSFHKFPKDPVTRAAWFAFCKLDTTVDDASNLFICSDHFTLYDYIGNGITVHGQKMFLKRGSVPSIFKVQSSTTPASTSGSQEMQIPNQPGSELPTRIWKDHFQEIHDFDLTKEEIPMEENQQEKLNEMFTCDQCSKTYKYQSSLALHKWSAHLIDVYHRCKLCERRFVTDSSLRSHVVRHVTVCDGEKFTCNVCEETINSSVELEQHLLEHEMERTRNCEGCCVSFEVRPPSELAPEHSPVIAYKCDWCSKTFKTQYHVTVHAKQEHENAAKFLCDLCGKTFTHSHQLRGHTLGHEVELTAKCDQCPKRYSTEEQLSAHKNHAHTTVEHLTNRKEIEHAAFEMFSCPSCVKLSPLPPGLENVIYKCNQCDNTCTSMENLVLHKYHVHSQRMFQCKDCSKKFKLDLKATSKKEKPFKNTKKPEFSHRWFTCKVCHKTFPSLFLLNNHKKIEHTGFSCYSCRKRVSFPTQPGSLTYNCDQCDNTYKVLKNFILHKQYVHAQKWFLCENCSEKLIKYRNQETENNVVGKDFKCEVCHRSFSTEKFLTNHIKLEHTIDGRCSCRSCGKQFSFPSEPGNLTYKCDRCDYTCKTMKHLISHNYYLHWQRTFQCDGCSKDGLVLNLETNLTNLSDHKQEQEETFEEVSVKEEPLEWYDPEVIVKEEMDVKEEPEEVDEN